MKGLGVHCTTHALALAGTNPSPRQVLPPALEQGEKARTMAADGERWHSGKQDVVNRVEIDPDTFVRLVDIALVTTSPRLSLARPVLVMVAFTILEDQCSGRFL